MPALTVRISEALHAIKGRYVYGNYIEQSEVRADIQTLEVALRVAVEVMDEAIWKLDEGVVSRKGVANILRHKAQVKIAKILAEKGSDTTTEGCRGN